MLGPENATDNWLIEMPPGGLLREGLTKDFVKAGGLNVVHVNPLKSGGKASPGSVLTTVPNDRRIVQKHVGRESPPLAIALLKRLPLIVNVPIGEVK